MQKSSRRKFPAPDRGLERGPTTPALGLLASGLRVEEGSDAPGLFGAGNGWLVGLTLAGLAATGAAYFANRGVGSPKEDANTEDKTQVSQANPTVKGFGVINNQGLRRKQLEDFYITVENFNNEPESMLLGVFDGHGGAITAAILKASYEEKFSAEIKSGKNTSFSEAFASTHNELDAIVKEKSDYASGSTSVVVVVTGKNPNMELSDGNSERWVHAANAGDSRAVLCSSRGVQRLTRDHTADDQEEVSRVIIDGGQIVNNRLGGSLMVLRSFGDRTIKAITSQPYTFSAKVNGPATVIIASDGLWDVVTDEEACAIAAMHPDPQNAASALGAEAVKRKSTDDITVIVANI